jgi:hypothetical protein
MLNLPVIPGDKQKGLASANPSIFWRPQRDANARYRLERAAEGAWQVLENTDILLCLSDT